jgi:hypothetical protein
MFDRPSRFRSNPEGAIVQLSAQSSPAPSAGSTNLPHLAQPLNHHDILAASHVFTPPELCARCLSSPHENNRWPRERPHRGFCAPALADSGKHRCRNVLRVDRNPSLIFLPRQPSPVGQTLTGGWQAVPGRARLELSFRSELPWAILCTFQPSLLRASRSLCPSTPGLQTQWSRVTATED